VIAERLRHPTCRPWAQGNPELGDYETDCHRGGRTLNAAWLVVIGTTVDTLRNLKPATAFRA